MCGRALRLAAVLAVAVLATGGCDATADDGHRWPAAAAGPACQLLDYDVVAAQIGTHFDVAGGAREGDTVTCALARAGEDYPDLTLAMTATAADEVIFQAIVTPSGSTAVKGLGRIAYRLPIAAAAERGPGLEYGWLTIDGRLMILRYTCAPKTPLDQVDALATKLLSLAQHIDAGRAQEVPSRGFGVVFAWPLGSLRTMG